MHQYLLIVVRNDDLLGVYWWRFSFYGIPFLLTWLYNLSIVIPGVSSIVFLRYALIMNTLLWIKNNGCLFAFHTVNIQRLRIENNKDKLSSDIVLYNYLIEFYTVEILLEVIVILWLNLFEQDLPSIYFKYSCD